MISLLTSRSTEPTTRAPFWAERKWQWIVDAVVFLLLGLSCAWPMPRRASASWIYVSDYRANSLAKQGSQDRMMSAYSPGTLRCDGAGDSWSVVEL